MLMILSNVIVIFIVMLKLTFSKDVFLLYIYVICVCIYMCFMCIYIFYVYIYMLYIYKLKVNIVYMYK